MQRTSARTHGIDILRGVACLSVMAFHFLSLGARDGRMPELPLPVIEPVARYGFLGVHLFYMVSGYVIFMSAIGRTPREFMASRVSRLYPALWIAASITMLVTQWHANPAMMVSWRDFAWNLTLVPQYARAYYVDGSYWSLAVELQFYLFVGAALALRLTERVDWLLWAWIALSLADAVHPNYRVEKWLIAGWAPFFIIGAVTYLGAARGWTRARQGLFAVSTVLACWHGRHEILRLAAQSPATPAPDAAISVTIILLLTGIFVVVASERVRFGPTKWATTAGVLTYPVYLVHQNVGYAMYAELRAMQVPAAVAFFVIVAVILVVASLIHTYVEKPLGPRLRALVVATRQARPVPSVAA